MSSEMSTTELVDYFSINSYVADMLIRNSAIQWWIASRFTHPDRIQITALRVVPESAVPWPTADVFEYRPGDELAYYPDIQACMNRSAWERWLAAHPVQPVTTPVVRQLPPYLL